MKSRLVLLFITLTLVISFSASSAGVYAPELEEVEKKITQYYIGENDIKELNNRLDNINEELDRVYEETLRIYEEAKKIEAERLEREKLRSFIIKKISLYKKHAKLDDNTVEQIADTILKYGDIREMDPLLITSVIQIESHFNPRLVYSADDTGLMQVIPSTGKMIAEQLGETWDYNMLFDIDTNIKFGTYYLKNTIGFYTKKNYKYNSAVFNGLIGYNRGGTRAYNELKRGEQVTEYGDKVMPVYNKLRKEWNEIN